jgi:hypothetical protein
VDLIQEVAWNNTPQIEKKVIGNNCPLEIRKVIEQKRKARRTWQKTKSTENKTILNNLMQQLTREIRKIKNKSVYKYLQELTAESKTDYSLWRVTKYLKRHVCHKPQLKRENGTWAKENKERTELFAEHLENTFTPNTSEDVEDELDEVINEETGIIPPVSRKDVKRRIRQQISPKKAPGYDLIITSQILKKLPRKAIIKIMHIINATFRMRYIPGIWKIAELLMILKPGKPPNKVDSYRLISLLPIMSKLFEKLLLIRLKSVVTKKKLILNHQFGFRNQHSTLEWVHRIIEAMYSSISGCVSGLRQGLA